MWSSFLGRIPQLPSAIIGINKPNNFPNIESELWQPYSSRTTPDQPPQPCRVQAIATRYCEISEILGDILCMFFLPRERVTPNKLSDLYSRLKTWRGQLPEDMDVESKAYMDVKGKALPSVLGLQ